MIPREPEQNRVGADPMIRIRPEGDTQVIRVCLYNWRPFRFTDGIARINEWHKVSVF